MNPLLRLALLIGVILLLPLLAPYDPMTTDSALSFQPPTMAHLLGTDQFGRDVLSRTLHGGRNTLLIAFTATAIGAASGLALGLVASGRAAAAPWSWLGESAQLLMNAAFAIPGLVLALVMITLLGSGAGSVALAVGISQIAPFARLTQTAARQVRSMGYIEAARALGAGDLQLLLRHVLPNISAALAAALLLTFAYSLLNSAALNAIGLGSAPGTPDWGVMLYEGRQAFRVAPWVSIGPGIATTALIWIAQKTANNL